MAKVKKVEDISFKDMLAELDEINNWFQNEDIDLDEGLKKLKRGKDLIKDCRKRLKSVENEFEDISKDFTVEDKDEETKIEAVKPEMTSQSDDVEDIDKLPF